MGKNVITCDWLKRPIDKSEPTHQVMIGKDEFIFSEEGFKQMMIYLHSTRIEDTPPLMQVEASAADSTDTDPLRTLTKNDVKPPPRPSEEMIRALLDESQRIPAFSLPTLSDATVRREAQRRLDEANRQIRNEFHRDDDRGGFRFNWDEKGERR